MNLSHACRAFLAAAALLGPSAGALLATGETARAANRPNIVFILADDQRFDTIGALGNPEIRTPHLDRLVQRGFHFTNAYCMGSMVGAVCMPSRSMLLTGRSLWRLPENLQSTQAPPGVPLLPTALREAGYATFHCGKRGNSCRFAHAAFDVNVEMDGRTENSASVCADAAISFLRQHAGKPFFLYLAPQVPHDPRLAPARFAALYDPARLSLSKNFLPQHPFDNGELAVRDELLAAQPRSESEMRQHLADYYATISHLDAEVGRVLDAVAERGGRDDTLILFSSDQGLAVGGRHGLMGKQNLYEHVKPPLVVAGPGIPPGKSDALVYLFDLFPTICELAGARVPQTVEGRSLVPALSDPDWTARGYLFAAYKDCQRMVRDARWKLIEYRVGDARHTQLFDLADDPDELRNLAGDPRLADQRRRLERQLEAERRAWNDPVP